MSFYLNGSTHHTMPWVRIDDRFPNHPKALAAGSDGVALWLEGLCYANTYSTNGFLPAGVVRRFRLVKRPVPTAQRLVSVGLWELQDRGYLIHDYEQFYPPPEGAKVPDESIARARYGVGTPLRTSTSTSTDTQVPEYVQTSRGREEFSKVGHTVSAESAAKVWALWSEVAAAHGAPVRLVASPKDLITCTELGRAYAPEALRAALTCWWASPHVPSRSLHFFRAQADEVMAHLRTRPGVPFRAPVTAAQPASPDADFWRQVDAHTRKKGAP